MPDSQSSHDVELVNGCAVPPAHSVQLLWLLSSLYLPASHALQVDAPDPLYVPASQREQDDAPEKEKLPVAQSEQLVNPTPLKVPALHDSQLVCPVDCW